MAAVRHANCSSVSVACTPYRPSDPREKSVAAGSAVCDALVLFRLLRLVAMKVDYFSLTFIKKPIRDLISTRLNQLICFRLHYKITL